MFCSNCGAQIQDGSYVCPSCGAQTGASQPTQTYSQPQNYQTGYTQQPQQGYYQQPQQGYYQQPYYPGVETETSGTATLALVLAFLVPLAGLILGIVGLSKYKNPQYRSRCTAAIVVSIVIPIITGILSGIFVTLVNSYL